METVEISRSRSELPVLPELPVQRFAGSSFRSATSARAAPAKMEVCHFPRHAHAADAPASPDSPRGWVYEEKVDGSRMVAHKNGNTVHLISRQGKEFTQRFPELAKAVAALGAESVISSSSPDSNGSGLSRRAMWPRRPCSWSLTCWSSTARTSGSDPCANADQRSSIS